MSRTKESLIGDATDANSLRASIAHRRCLDCVYPRAPDAASAKKLAKWVGSAGRNGVPSAAAYASHRVRVEA